MNRRQFLGWLGVASIGAAACEQHPRPAGAHPAVGLPQARPGFRPDVDVALFARPSTRSIRPGLMTRVWSYFAELQDGPAATVQAVEGSYLGPTLRVRTGQKVRLRFTNQLPEPTVLHMHGLHVPEELDGHPRYAIGNGQTLVYEFEVVNRAGTYWYHPHHHDRTGLQVHAGLAGLLLVSDAEEAALNLPSGADELLWVIQDRTFDVENQFVYLGGMPMDRMNGFLGDEVLVNGRREVALDLATRVYRARVVNGSNARIYKLAWGDGTPLTVIGTDGGLLERPRAQPYVTLAPGERADLIIDLRERAVGSSLLLQSRAFEGANLEMGGGMQMGRGMPMGRGRGGGMRGGGGDGGVPNGAALTILTVRIARKESSDFRLPERLSTYDDSWQPGAATEAAPRRFAITMSRMQWLLNNRTFEMDRAASDETVRLGSKEVWEFANVNSMMRMPHPIHLHGRQFRVLRRTIDPALAANWESLREGFTDQGWKDTVLVMPGEQVQILSHFQHYPGLFLYHCHNLEHEDMGMMRNYHVIA